MKFAFILFKYYPYGGLERDFLRIAQLAVANGHQVDVYTMAWQGPKPLQLTIHILPVRGWTNHKRVNYFTAMLTEILPKQNYSAVVGFNRMPGLDIYYAADVCYRQHMHEKHGAWYRLTPRYRTYAALEKSVFDPNANTEIMLLISQQRDYFIQYYQTPSQRLHLLPPGIDRSRQAPIDFEIQRQRMRLQLEIADHQRLLLMVGSSFKRKGVDRAMIALASLQPDILQNTQLAIIGSGNKRPFLKIAKKLGVHEHVKFWGARDDVNNFLLAADVLLHPAYSETAGMAIIESIVAGLPVIVTGICGYANYVSLAKAGIVLPEPFEQTQLNAALLRMLTTPERLQWQRNALSYAKSADIYSLPQRAIELIIATANKNDSNMTRKSNVGISQN